MRSGKTFGIVATTVFDGSFVDEYYHHFTSTGQVDAVRLYVVGDLATPAVCKKRVERYRAEGLRWQYLGVDEQNEFLRPFPALAAEIPWKSDNRRNVGYLVAYRDGCDVIIAIDDDNFPKSKSPFLDGHSTVGENVSLPAAEGYNGWFNLCSMMTVQCHSLGGGETIYPRGFPYARRNIECAKISPSFISGRVAVNVGLWSGDPDVDAATRLVTRCETTERSSESYLLSRKTLMPINTQNTAILREALPAYYYVKMGHSIGGMKLDRFGDIFSGFFLQKCAQAVGDCVRVGSPVVEHRRTPHNLYKDLWNELAGMVIIEDMLPLLENDITPARSYTEAILELAEQLTSWATRQQGFLWDVALKDYFLSVVSTLRLWVAVISKL